MAESDKMREFACEKQDEHEQGKVYPVLDSPTVTVTPHLACIYCGRPTDIHSVNFPYCSRGCSVLAECDE